jgi:hypothetical protein
VRKIVVVSEACGEPGGAWQAREAGEIEMLAQVQVGAGPVAVACSMVELSGAYQTFTLRVARPGDLWVHPNGKLIIGPQPSAGPGSWMVVAPGR